MTISGFVAYVKQVWKNKPDTSSPLSAERLNTIEGGIKGNSDAIEAIAAAVVNQIVNDPNKIASMAALYSVNSQVTQLNSDLTGKSYSLISYLTSNISAADINTLKSGKTVSISGVIVVSAIISARTNYMRVATEAKPSRRIYFPLSSQVSGAPVYAMIDSDGYVFCDSQLPVGYYFFNASYIII